MVEGIQQSLCFQTCWGQHSNSNLWWVPSWNREGRGRVGAGSPHVHELLWHRSSRRLAFATLPEMERADRHRWCVCGSQIQLYSLDFFFFFCLCSYVAQMIRRREIILYVKGAVLKSVRYFLARKCFICFLRVSFDLLSLPPILDNCTVSNRIDRSFKIKSNVGAIWK